MRAYLGVPQNLTPYMVQCTECQSIVLKDQTQAHDQFHTRLKDEATHMSNVQWCDPGNHAFKAGEKGSQSFNGTQVNEEGIPVTVRMDACSKHSFRPMATAPELENDSE